jgi:hypothetical protein
MEYPPAGAVSLPVKVMITGPVIAVAAFKALMANASEVYEPASAGVVFAGFVTITCPFTAVPKNTSTITRVRIAKFLK